jgi:5,10-methylenetetrahydromethanopterin reductase
VSVRAPTPVRLGIAFDGGDPPDALRAIALEAERAGAVNAWMACHLFEREPIASAAITLAATQSIGVVLMAMSPYTVHPVYATMAAATLDECFPGRVQLCFGVGSPRELSAIAVASPRPLQTLREAIEIARLLLKGETVAFEGERFRISNRRLATGAHRVAVKLAASGPRMLELGGEIADGIVISAGTSPQFIRWSLDHVRRGEERSGRRAEKAALVFCAAEKDERAAHERLRPQLAYILRNQHHARNLALAGTRLDQAALAQAFARKDWSAIRALISDDVVRRHSASGTPEQVAAALANYQSAGLDEIVIIGARDSAQVRDVLASSNPSGN